MNMTLAPRRIELRALIEEARRRARQRRLALAAIIVAAAAGIAAGLALTGGSASRVDAPPGFTVVKAKGQVAHAVIEYGRSVRITSLSGSDRPAKMTEEFWYDARGGLWRDVIRVDGRVRSDRAGTCPVAGEEGPPCGAALQLTDLRPVKLPSPGDYLHVTGSGRFRGRPVIWLEGRLPTRRNEVMPQIGLDARTHRLVVQRYLSHDGHQVGDETVISQQPSLPSDSVSFVLRKHAAPGAPRAFERVTGHLLAYGLPAARRALGRDPLWLGPRFHGFPLRSVQSGTYPFGTTKIGALHRVPYVAFSYGGPASQNYAFTVEEFGSIRPYFYKQGPREGSIERDVYGMSMARMTSDGLLLRIMPGAPPFRLTQANAVAIARALRPLPPGLKTVPTLRQQ
jgi:hypothetical protein